MASHHSHLIELYYVKIQHDIIIAWHQIKLQHSLFLTLTLKPSVPIILVFFFKFLSAH